MTTHPAFTYVIALSIVCCAVNSQSLNQVVQCTTPSGDFGSCILLESCQSLVREVRSRGFSVEVFRRSQCGFIGAKPKVCCANNPNPIVFREPGAATSTAKTAREQASIPTQQTQTVNFPNTDNNESDDGAKPVPQSTTLHLNNIGGSVQTISRADRLPGTDTCGSVAVTSKIYGGKNTSIDEFPWTVLLKHRTANSKEHYGCGGVLINHRYVLTAAHCVSTRGYRVVQVRLGEWNSETEVDCVSPSECNAAPLDIDIEESVYHADFDPSNYTNDVALIRLKRDVVYTDWVQAICLPDSKDKDFTDENFWVAGWGKTENGTTSPVKLKLEVRHVNIETCRAAYRRLRIVLGNGVLCAGGRAGQDTCAGDSGGSLMKLLPGGPFWTNYYAVGIVSLGPSRCGIEGWPGVYTKVSHYMDWIISNLKP